MHSKASPAFECILKTVKFISISQLYRYVVYYMFHSAPYYWSDGWKCGGMVSVADS